MNFYEQIFSRGRATGEGMTHFERLFAAKFGGSPPPEVREYTGAVPVTITADGTPLLDLLISGNKEHTGTPTPDNPIIPEGCGERTGNLYNINAKDVNNGYVNNAQLNKDGTTEAWNLCEVTEYIELTPNETYRLSNIGSYNSLAYCIYDSDKQYITGESYSGQAVKAINIPPNGKYLRFSHVKSRTDTMLNLGSTAIPYEPYGYKIPISSAGQTTPVYLGEVQTTRKIKKLVLTGDENWSEMAAGLYRITVNGYLRIIDIQVGISSHFGGGYTATGAPSAKRDELVFLVSNSGNNYVYLSPSQYLTTAEFKTYLAQQYANGTPVTIWYVLANETTGIVNEPLMKIGDYADTLSKEQAGVSIPTNNGSTTVDVDTTVKPSEVYIKYMGR